MDTGRQDRSVWLCSWPGPSSWFILGPGQWESQFSGLFLRPLIPSWGLYPHYLIYTWFPPTAPPPNVIALAFGLQHINLAVHTYSVNSSPWEIPVYACVEISRGLLEVYENLSVLSQILGFPLPSQPVPPTSTWANIPNSPSIRVLLFDMKEKEKYFYVN